MRAFAPDDLSGETEVGHAAARGAVVFDDALAVAGRFGQAHVARHDGAEHAVAEVPGEFGRHRIGEAPSHGQSIVGYDKASRGGIAYMGLAGEVLRRQREREQAARTPAREAAA